MEFRLEGEEFITLQALLKVCSLVENGGAAKNAIAGGEVKVDGATETRRGKKIRAGQVVAFAGKEIRVLV